ncbi:MAG: M28 family peptidase [Flavobacteriales bacterium]
MIRSCCALFCCALLLSPARAQVDTAALRYAGTITRSELLEHLTIIASDAYKGRDTGKEGQKMAAAYLKQAFMQAGIPPVMPRDPAAIVDGYFQPFEVIEERSGTISLVQGERVFGYGKELVYFQETLSDGFQVDRLTFIPAKQHPAPNSLEGQDLVIDGTRQGGIPGLLAGLRDRSDEFRKAGARLVLVIVDDLGSLAEQMHLRRSQMRLADQAKKTPSKEAGTQVVLVDAAAMQEMLGDQPLGRWRKKKRFLTLPVQMRVEVTTAEQRLITENVLAYIEGTDKKDEVVVLTAHYDHVGVEDGVVYNGADDDGTGTVAMIEIAEAFALAKAAGEGPRRSVLVMPVSGEEKGLLGSRYYSEHPVFPLVNTVADLNIDMIGRRDSVHATSEPYIYVIGSDRLSTGLHEANERANELYSKLTLDYTFNAESDPNRFYYRSDHYNFARKGVPSLFYFSGIHEDYHQPGDDVEKIDFDLLHQRTLLAFHTAWILANQEQRIVVDKPVKP